MSSLRSHRHELFCETIKNTGLSAFDDKRFLINNTKSYAYGHFRIASEQQSYEKETAIYQLVEYDIFTPEEHVFDLMEEQSFVIDELKVTPCVKK